MSVAGRRVAARAAALVAVVLTSGLTGGCTHPRATGATHGGGPGGRLVYGTPAPASTTDPAFAGDPESLRAVAQVFETLVATRPGGTDPVPGLATSWNADPDRRSWTFRLRPGVRFADGAPLDAAAVCANVDRWNRLLTTRASPALRRVWEEVLGADTAGGPSVACSVPSAQVAQLVLPTASAVLPAALALPTLGLLSPASLRLAPARPTPPASGVLVGSGPFAVAAVRPGGALVLRRSSAYWGDRTPLDELVLQPVRGAGARYRALLAGTIQGYDRAEASDVAQLQGSATVLRRPAYDVAWLGMDQRVAPMGELAVRRAVAHAVDRVGLVRALYPPGTPVAREFSPPLLAGYAEDVPFYAHDAARSRRLLAAVAARFPALLVAYPVGQAAPSPSLPDPAALAQELVADLRAVGFTATASGVPEAGYARALASGRYALWLGSHAGLVGDPDDFLGRLFRSPRAGWGFTSSALVSLLGRARAEPDPRERARDYERANRLVMRLLPGVPLAHSQVAVVLAARVKGFVPSPLGLESFATVSVR